MVVDSSKARKHGNEGLQLAGVPGHHQIRWGVAQGGKGPRHSIPSKEQEPRTVIDSLPIVDSRTKAASRKNIPSLLTHVAQDDF